MRFAVFASMFLVACDSGLDRRSLDPQYGTSSSERSEESDARVLHAANTLDFDTLDIDVGLDRRAAQSIVDGRPFDTIEALDEAWYVGPAAMQHLLDYSLEHLTDFDCPTGTAHSSNGAEYHTLDEAARRTPDGGEITLCPGSFSLSLDIRKALTISGRGEHTTIAADSWIPDGVTVEDATISGRLTGDDALFRRVHFTEADLTLADSSILDSTCTDSEVELRRSNRVRDSAFTNCPVVLDHGESLRTFFNDSSFHGAEVAIDVRYGRPTLLNVDLGVGATENGIDVRTLNHRYHDFIFVERHFCDSRGCGPDLR